MIGFQKFYYNVSWYCFCVCLFGLKFIKLLELMFINFIKFEIYSHYFFNYFSVSPPLHTFRNFNCTYIYLLDIFLLVPEDFFQPFFSVSISMIFIAVSSGSLIFSSEMSNLFLSSSSGFLAFILCITLLQI